MSREHQIKHIDLNFAIEKTKKYCSYQERCVFDVLKKLFDLGLPKNKHQEIVNKLISENYVDEQRFTESFVQGKLKHNKWGKIKITFALRQKNIPEYIIKKSIEKIDETEYKNILKEIIEKKQSVLKEKNKESIKAKLAYYATSKGFEPYLIWEIIKSVKKEIKF